MMGKIAEYKNGNTQVTLYSDGTKVREYEGIPKPKFPESIDMKITNYCSEGCEYCYTNSIPEGEHGDLDWALGILKGLPAGVEIAIGGGNALTHPKLVWFLEELKEQELIANITVNQKSLTHIDTTKLEDFTDKNLIHGIGISISLDTMNRRFSLPIIQDLQIENENVVFHLIAGIHDPKIIDELIEKMPYCKILILGYKQIGRGEDYFNNVVQKNLDNWYREISRYIGKCVLSFDNLAIEQLKIKRLFTDEGWKKFYMGDDGEFSCYIDAVEKTIQKSSIDSTDSKFF